MEKRFEVQSTGEASSHAEGQHFDVVSRIQARKLKLARLPPYQI